MKYFIFSLLLPYCLLLCQNSDYSVKGKIIDFETLKPLVEANIIILGTTNGTVTDSNGNFFLSIPKNNSIIKVSEIGYDSKEIGLIFNCNDNLEEKNIVLKLKQSNVIMSGATPFYNKSSDSTEIKGRIDAIDEISSGIYSLLQTTPITEIEEYYKIKYSISFIVDKTNLSTYRIAFNQIVLAALVKKYGYEILEKLNSINWHNY